MPSEESLLERIAFLEEENARLLRGNLGPKVPHSCPLIAHVQGRMSQIGEEARKGGLIGAQIGEQLSELTTSMDKLRLLNGELRQRAEGRYRLLTLAAIRVYRDSPLRDAVDISEEELDKLARKACKVVSADDAATRTLSYDELFSESKP